MTSRPARVYANLTMEAALTSGNRSIQSQSGFRNQRPHFLDDPPQLARIVVSELECLRLTLLACLRKFESHPLRSNLALHKGLLGICRFRLHFGLRWRHKG